MSRTPPRCCSIALALVAAVAISPAARAALVVTLDVPQLASAGSARGFEFVSLQFDVYLEGLGDCASDYCANVLANDRENYTYLAATYCGQYCPPTYIRTDGNTYSATYEQVTSPPTGIDAYFHFSGEDVAGQALSYAVQSAGSYTLTLTDDGTNATIPLDTPLSSGLYTLRFQTEDLQGAEIVATTVPLPPVGAMMLAPGFFVAAMLRRKAGITTKLRPGTSS